MASPDLRKAHFDGWERLLELERSAQEAREKSLRAMDARHAEEAGQRLSGLRLADEAPGSGGRMELVLERPGGAVLPFHRFRVGSVVRVGCGDAESSAVVTVVERSRIRVAADPEAWPLEADGPLHLQAGFDDVTFRRQRAALARGRQANAERAERLDRWIGAQPPEIPRPDAMAPDPASALNPVQEEVATWATASPHLALIHGPPGTGKTRTLVEVICRRVAAGQKVLATAPSNLACDHLAERLVAHRVRVVRLGHPVRILPALQERSLEHQLERHPRLREARRALRRASSLFSQAERTKRTAPPSHQRREMRQEARALRADARRLEAEAIEEIFDQAQVLVSTLSLDEGLLRDREFDCVCIDEASQATEPACWAAVMRAAAVVLAGDHQQLPPVVISPEAQQAGFGLSPFERLHRQSAGAFDRVLRVQYRMSEALVSFPSARLYGGLLQTAPEVAGRPEPPQPLCFLDTAGAGHHEELGPDGESRFNPAEARLLEAEVRRRIEQGETPDNMGVIAPYGAQVRLLRERMFDLVPHLEIDSVDGFQGREKDSIFISFVRSNEEGNIGFLSEVRRTNVAITRARRSLFMVGDSATLGGHPFYSEYLEHLAQSGALRSVWECEEL